MRTVGDETILVPIRSGMADLDCVYTLDEVAGFIWNLLESPRSEDEIVSGILAEFDVSEEEARRDVASFLGDLSEARLVERA